MAPRKDSALKDSGKHPWRGVVEDFVDLKLDEHSYECIYTHTENLMQKTMEDSVSKRDMVFKGVLRPLVAVLGFPDKRKNASLQRMAAVTITTIVTAFPNKHICAYLVRNGVVCHVHDLLKLRRSRPAQAVLELLDVINFLGDSYVFSSAPECAEALIEATHCTNATVKHSALKLLPSIFLKKMPSPEKTRCYVHDLNRLLRDRNPQTVLLTCELYALIARTASVEATLAMMDTEMLPLFAEVVQRAHTSAPYVAVAEIVMKVVNSLGDRSDDHVQLILESGILDCLLSVI